MSRDPAVRLAGAKALEGAPDEWLVELADVAPADADVVVCGPDVPECGGIAFDPARPDALLGSIGATARAAPVLAVVAASGGCGVTTIALHLARAYRSCIVECGARAGVAERLALDRRELRTWEPESPRGPGLDLAALPMAEGYRAYFAPCDDPPGLDGVVGAAAERFDPVVLDVPHGRDLDVESDAIVLVMPATVPGAIRARGVLARLPAGPPRAVVANRIGPGGETTRRQLQRVLGEGLALELPTCAVLRDAEDDGALLPARHRWARRLARLGTRLHAAARSPGRAAA